MRTPEPKPAMILILGIAGGMSGVACLFDGAVLDLIPAYGRGV